MDKQIKVKNIPTQVKVHKPEAEQFDRFNPGRSIYVRAVSGIHQKIRKYLGFVAMLSFMLLPWLSFDNHQAVLFDIFNQRFNIFGLTLWPQDFTILAWLFMIGAFALFLVTTFYGRVWCGYMCPQTVWTFIFIWFEEKCEGTANKRKKLDQRPLDIDKFLRKFAKHFSWVAFSLLTALTFVGYFTPIRELVINIFTFQASSYALGGILFFAFCTYGNAGWMREIMCLHICPYSRFQSAMFDKDTFTVTYDERRGENRGPRGRKKDPKELGLGDCIDCKLCVHVCPTGIDIRNGLQYECINCGACIDACDGVMDKMKYQKGLISYTTERNVTSDKKTHALRPKIIGYLVVMLIIVGIFVADVVTRIPMDLDIIRDRNQLYRINTEGLVENTFTLKILNKSQKDHRYEISIDGLNNYSIIGKTSVTIRTGESYSLPLSIAIDPYDLSSPITEFDFVLNRVDDPDVKIEHSSKYFKGR